MDENLNNINTEQQVPEISGQDSVNEPVRGAKPVIRNKKQIVMLVAAVAGLTLGISGMKAARFFSSKAAVYTSSLRMPASVSLKVGEQTTVPVIMDTQGAGVVGVDVLMKFDPVKLELISIKPASAGTTNLKYFAPADTAGIFKSADVMYKANSVGIIEFGAATYDYAGKRVLPAFSGTTYLADLVFRAKTSGTAAVTFDMVSGSTKDTNIVVIENSPIDVLSAATQITNLTLTISPVATPTPTTAVVPTVTSGPTPVPTLLPTATPVPVIPTATPRPLPTSTPIPVPTATPRPTPTPVVILPTPTPAPTSQIVKINPVKDTYVRGDASVTYGSSSTLYVDGKPQMVTFMLFDLSAWKSGSVSTAKLSFRTTSGAYSGSPNRAGVYLVDNTTWPENMSYSSRPVVSAVKLGEVLASSANTVYTVVLDRAIVTNKLGGLMAIAIVPTGEDALYFYSRESSVYKPQLELGLTTASTGSQISIFAAGTGADGVYPRMDLLIGGQTAATYTNIAGDPTARIFGEYKFSSSQKVTHDQIRVAFGNDIRTSGGDRNLVVDRIIVDGMTYQSEDPAVFGTGVWTSSTGCTTGYLKTEWLYCNGYFNY